MSRHAELLLLIKEHAEAARETERAKAREVTAYAQMQQAVFSLAAEKIEKT